MGQRRRRRRERGTLIELQCLVALLMLAGLLLAQYHPLFILLAVAGLGIVVYPWLAGVLGAHSAASAAWRRLEAVKAQGFHVDGFVRARSSEGGALVAVDRGHSRLAFVTAEEARLMELREVRRVSLGSYTVSQWGHGTWTRHGFQVHPAQGEPFGLSYPSLRQARKAASAVCALLGPDVPFEEKL